MNFQASGIYGCLSLTSNHSLEMEAIKYKFYCSVDFSCKTTLNMSGVVNIQTNEFLSLWHIWLYVIYIQLLVLN